MRASKKIVRYFFRAPGRDRRANPRLPSASRRPKDSPRTSQSLLACRLEIPMKKRKPRFESVPLATVKLVAKLDPIETSTPRRINVERVVPAPTRHEPYSVRIKD